MDFFKINKLNIGDVYYMIDIFQDSTTVRKVQLIKVEDKFDLYKMFFFRSLKSNILLSCPNINCEHKFFTTYKPHKWISYLNEKDSKDYLYLKHNGISDDLIEKNFFNRLPIEVRRNISINKLL